MFETTDCSVLLTLLTVYNVGASLMGSEYVCQARPLRNIDNEQFPFRFISRFNKKKAAAEAFLQYCKNCFRVGCQYPLTALRNYKFKVFVHCKILRLPGG